MAAYLQKTVVSTHPSDEPVTLEDVKDALRISGSDHDSALENLIQQARKYVEFHTGRALVTQTRKLYLDSWDTEISLPFPPLQSVSSIKYRDTSNVEQTLAASNYTVDSYQEPAVITQSYGGSYPALYPDKNAITVTYTCGYGAADDVPERMKEAIKLYIQWIFDHDEDSKAVLDRFIDADKVNW